MQPEVPPRKSGTSGPAGAAAPSGTDSEDRAGRARDLTGAPFPLGDGGEPSQRLDELYQGLEA
ncbi:SLATT domain-containing protein, partial [Streptomyces sp. DT225]